MKQIGEISVRDYMTEQALVVQQDTLLTDAIRIMDEERISVVPVVDRSGNLTGILSNSDLVEITHEVQADLSALHDAGATTGEFLVSLLKAQGDNVKVQDVMTAPVETVSVNTNLIVAAQQLNDRRIHHLPVIDESGTCLGIIAASDFVRAIAENGALAAG